MLATQDGKNAVGNNVAQQLRVARLGDAILCLFHDPVGFCVGQLFAEIVQPGEHKVVVLIGAEYAGVFRALFGSLRPGGWLVATDCSRANFFNDVGTTSPFMPDIEWHKHQSPGTWDRLLRQVGFAAARVQWSSPNTLGALGRLLLGNRFAAYFLLSHFRLAARKPLTAAS